MTSSLNLCSGRDFGPFFLYNFLEQFLELGSFGSLSEATIMGLLPIDQINGMDYKEFISTFGNVVEHCGLLAAAIWSQKPFDKLQGIHKVFCDFIDTLPELGKDRRKKYIVSFHFLQLLQGPKPF